MRERRTLLLEPGLEMRKSLDVLKVHQKDEALIKELSTSMKEEEGGGFQPPPEAPEKTKAGRFGQRTPSARLATAIRHGARRTGLSPLLALRFRRNTPTPAATYSVTQLLRPIAPLFFALLLLRRIVLTVALKSLCACFLFLNVQKNNTLLETQPLSLLLYPKRRRY